MMDSTTESEVRALIAQGRKIEAIRRAREATGLGLAEAKDLVERLERGQPVELPPAPSSAPDGSVEADVRRLLVEGKKIQAIKLLRESTGIGLAEAKDAVEKMAEGIPGARRSAGCLGAGAVTGILMVAPVVWALLR